MQTTSVHAMQCPSRQARESALLAPAAWDAPGIADQMGRYAAPQSVLLTT